MAPSIAASSAGVPNYLLTTQTFPAWAHEEVKYWYPEWRLIRDVCEGERAVKTMGRQYLPALETMEDAEYRAYLDRATFYGFTERTASALKGAIFRRREQIEGLNDRLIDRLDSFSREDQRFSVFASMIAEEQIKMGRVGVLIDLPAETTTDPRPYAVMYTAENIIDWETALIEGRQRLKRIVLREARLLVDPKTGIQRYLPIYRECFLTSTGPDREYMQKVYYSTDADKQSEVKLTEEFLQETFPVRSRGTPLKLVPFRIFGTLSSGFSVEKPVIQAIARLNISHYRSYAYLEHGRFFCGFPTYYVEASQSGSGEDEGEFEIGAARVWVTPPGSKPGILEMNGQGLKFLVDALDIKEQQAAALGGRIMGIRGVAVSESDNQLKLSERNEQSALLMVTRALDAGFTWILRMWAFLQDVPASELQNIKVEFNKDFLFDGIGAREFRAIQAMYKDGIIPIEVVYEYLRKSNVIPDWMDIAQFRRLLDRMESFPNNADVEAKKEGFADAKSRDLSKQQDKTLDSTLELQQEELAFEEEQAALDRKAAELQARRQEAAAKRQTNNPQRTSQQ